VDQLGPLELFDGQQVFNHQLRRLIDLGGLQLSGNEHWGTKSAFFPLHLLKVPFLRANLLLYVILGTVTACRVFVFLLQKIVNFDLNLLVYILLFQDLLQ
jgi:hypothetical protein